MRVGSHPQTRAGRAFALAAAQGCSLAPLVSSSGHEPHDRSAPAPGGPRHHRAACPRRSPFARLDQPFSLESTHGQINFLAPRAAAIKASGRTTSTGGSTTRSAARTKRRGHPRPERGKRREYLREYVRWLWPHRYAVGFFFLLALISAGLEMVEPLFMRFIIDRVLLEHRRSTRRRALVRLHLAGGAVPRASIVVSQADRRRSRTTASGC